MSFVGAVRPAASCASSPRSAPDLTPAMMILGEDWPATLSANDLRWVRVWLGRAGDRAALARLIRGSAPRAWETILALEFVGP